MKPLRIFPLVAVGFGLFASGCRLAESMEVSQELFPVQQVRAESIAHELEFMGHVHARQRAELIARIPGRIEAIEIDEGQHVAKGQLMFSIGATEIQQSLRRARAARASAEAELKAAELELEHTRPLYEQNVISKVEMELLAAQVRALSAKLEEAKAEEAQIKVELAYAEIRAPFAGTVNQIPKKTGSIVDEGELLTTLTNGSEVLVYFRVSEEEYLRYFSGTGEDVKREVFFRTASGELLPQSGELDAVGSEFDPVTGTIMMRARFPNEGLRLKHGSTGKVVFKTKIADALTIPQASTFEVQDHLYVYVVDGSDTARLRRIYPLLRFKDRFVVDSGLEAHERFIVSGVQKVTDGMKVAVAPDQS